jgi:hypothetical protein
MILCNAKTLREFGDPVHLFILCDRRLTLLMGSAGCKAISFFETENKPRGTMELWGRLLVAILFQKCHRCNFNKTCVSEQAIGHEVIVGDMI